MKPVIEVIVNKNWEVEPFLAAMADPKTRPEFLPLPFIRISSDSKTHRMASCRAEFKLQYIDVIVRCIEDLMDIGESGSNSEEKYRVLPNYIKADNPTMIISVSTAESTPDIQPEGTSENGSVFIGDRFYMYDGREFDKDSHSKLKPTESAEGHVPSKVYKLIEKLIDENDIIAKFLIPQHSPADKIKCLSGTDFVSVGVVNIINYEKYKQADPVAYESFKKSTFQGRAASIETTHGIVKMSAGNVAVMFVSPITDRYKCFDEDVKDDQNKIAAHNAGIMIGELLVALNNPDIFKN